MNCDHKTEEEYGVCNRCTAFRNIAHSAKRMLDARKKYMDQLLVDPSSADEAQYALHETIKLLEQSVNLATLAKLWD